jgi:hypothetical protein
MKRNVAEVLRELATAFRAEPDMTVVEVVATLEKAAAVIEERDAT